MIFTYYIINNKINIVMNMKETFSKEDLLKEMEELQKINNEIKDLTYRFEPYSGKKIINDIEKELQDTTNKITKLNKSTQKEMKKLETKKEN